jgi:hypothetical protein
MTMIHSSTCFERCNDVPDDDPAGCPIAPLSALTLDLARMVFTDHQFVTAGEVNLDHSDHLHARGRRLRYETRLCENPG